MFTKRELGIIALISSIITWILYSYKPRNYSVPTLILNSAVNFSLWFLIVGSIYTMIKLIHFFYKNIFYKKEHN
jgi:hypothetical protein